jgi:hypothetical protein
MRRKRSRVSRPRHEAHTGDRPSVISATSTTAHTAPLRPRRGLTVYSRPASRSSSRTARNLRSFSPAWSVTPSREKRRHALYTPSLDSARSRSMPPVTMPLEEPAHRKAGTSERPSLDQEERDEHPAKAHVAVAEGVRRPELHARDGELDDRVGLGHVAHVLRPSVHAGTQVLRSGRSAMASTMNPSAER